jgi:hypothetical protein
MFFIDTSFGSGTPSWYLVGKDIEDMSVDLGADTETIKNILDEVSVRHNGYEPSIEAEPFYADPSDPLYPKLKDIALNRKKGDDCKTKYLEVIVEDTEATSHSAWQEDCLIVPQSYGGDTSGFQIPFNVLPDGNRVPGTATLANKVPTFTA